MDKYQVVITAVPEQTVPFIKSLRVIASLGLADAKTLSNYLDESLPCLLVAGIDKEIADHVLHLVQEAGAGAKVEESEIPAPMLLCPQANGKYRWSWLSGRVAVE